MECNNARADDFYFYLFMDMAEYAADEKTRQCSRCIRTHAFFVSQRFDRMPDGFIYLFAFPICQPSYVVFACLRISSFNNVHSTYLSLFYKTIQNNVDLC